MKTWPKMTIAAIARQVAMGPFGSNLRVDTFVDYPAVPIISGAHLKKARVDVEGEFNFITEAHANSLLRANVQVGDVILTHAGTLGQVSLVPDSKFSRFVISQRQFYVRPNAEVVKPQFLTYFLRSPEGQHLLLANASQSGVPSIAQPSSYIKTILVPVPSLGEQGLICGMLDVLEDKMSANIRSVSAAEQLRRVMWSGLSQGAGVTPLSSCAQFVNGGAYTKDATGTGRVVVRIAELNNGIGRSTVYNELDVPDRQIARAGDLLMSWSGSLTAVRWYREDAIVNQHIFKVIPRDGYPVWAVACAVETKLDEFREIAAGKATTMGHIKRADLDSPVAWPEISDRLNDAGQALWDRALAAEQENLRLAATRDELLPLLMSGKITIKDAEKIVEGVL